MNRVISGSWPPNIGAPPVEELPGLKEIRTKDQANRTISTFEGSPKAWMEQFRCNPRKVTSLRIK
jgi:hypothetical protein